MTIGMRMAPDIEFEAQDMAETFDETNLTEDGEDIANFDDLVDVFDVTTSAEDDDDDDEDAPLDAADFDDDSFDRDALEAMRDDDDEADMDTDKINTGPGDDRFDADAVSTAAAEPASFESERLDDDDLEMLGYDDRRRLSPEEQADEHVDKQLDHGLKETFPASDPVSINPGAD